MKQCRIHGTNYRPDRCVECEQIAPRAPLPMRIEEQDRNAMRIVKNDRKVVLLPTKKITDNRRDPWF